MKTCMMGTSWISRTTLELTAWMMMKNEDGLKMLTSAVETKSSISTFKTFPGDLEHYMPTENSVNV